MPNVVQQSVALPAPPGTLYAMYLDPQAHAAFSGGGAVRIAPTVGTDWSAFDGRIHGRILALVSDLRVAGRRARRGLDSYLLGAGGRYPARAGARQCARTAV
jgi:hypothetical protein